MILVKLSSNMLSFKTVSFNQSGVSYILAKHNKPITSDTRNTYNGVGKSLIVHLIHFCLGASTKHYQDIVDKLPEWIFYLEFKINSKTYISERSTEKPDKILLNGKELSLRKFNELIKNLTFTIPETIDFLSFRSLLPFFIRPNKAAYVHFNMPAKVGSDYQKELNNGFLLGLDVNLYQEKYLVKKEQDRIKELSKNIQDDSLLKEYFVNNKDVHLRLIDIKEEISKLTKDIDKYEVASDYYDVKNEMNLIKQNLIAVETR